MTFTGEEHSRGEGGSEAKEVDWRRQGIWLVPEETSNIKGRIERKKSGKRSKVWLQVKRKNK